MTQPEPETPFLEIADFATEYGVLRASDRPQAERMLQIISDKIRERKPDVDETAAKQVVFEVTRDAVKYGDFTLLTKFSNTTSRRSESGDFDPDAKAVMIDDYLTGRQKLLIGLIEESFTKPAYYFGD